MEEEQVNRHQEEGEASPHGLHWRSTLVLGKGRGVGHAPRGLRMPRRGLCVRIGGSFGDPPRAHRVTRRQAAHFPGLVPSATTRSVHIGLGKREAGSGRGSLPHTGGNSGEGGGSLGDPLNPQPLTCTQPQRGAPDQHRVQAAGSAPWLSLAPVEIPC